MRLVGADVSAESVSLPMLLADRGAVRLRCVDMMLGDVTHFLDLLSTVLYLFRYIQSFLKN